MNLQESATSRKGPTVRGSSTSFPTASRTNQTTLNVQEAKDIWQHATLLFRNYDWSEAIIHIQRLLRRSRSTPGFNHAAVWANLGILRMHLGEYYLALEAFQKAVEKAGVNMVQATDLDGPRTFLSHSPQSTLSECVSKPAPLINGSFVMMTTPQNPMLTPEPTSTDLLPNPVSASAAAAWTSSTSPHSPLPGPWPRLRNQPSSRAAGGRGSATTAGSATGSTAASTTLRSPPPPVATTTTDLRTDASLVERTMAALVRHHQHHEAQATRHHHHPEDHLQCRRGGRLNTTTDTHPRNRSPRPNTATAAIYPFLAGLAAYHLPRGDDDDDDVDDVDDDDGSRHPDDGLRLAQRYFRTCLSLLPPRQPQESDDDDGEVKVDLRPLGLAWELERTRVVWNAHICGVRAAWEAGEGELVAGMMWGVNGVPGGLFFEFVE
ncbi:tetratricopeptide tpr-1 [Diplodia corticola]|uniref:Tetratricopeptide tpr-1 n=1 Tax=Diplodia corticola TaxID=236234 RepID=A0A1J9RUT3_9PEZI|nr:tetratricopeptide tpr-1 [Diplodia corticola]OJD36347.1 tetratricopeptide tpr-1 [Diplodia corticola]